MKINVICFTKQGEQLAKEFFLDWKPEEVSIYCKQDKEHQESLQAWTKEAFLLKNALVFVGACGIAVRAIAPYLQDKLSDSPVVCMDEAGQFVIPILSGHMGGANELAQQISKKIGAIPVLSTATDVNETFAVDLFAKRNHLAIQNKEGIARISAKVLKQELVDIVISPDATQLSHGILRLKPREYILGIGCKKGKSYQELSDFIQKWLDFLQLELSDVRMIASIDLKKAEPGLVKWAGCNRIPFLTYSPEELEKTEGHFEGSFFVKEKTGVDNVCERAAVKAAKGEGELILPKQAENGMTIAVVHKKWKLETEKQEGILIEDVSDFSGKKPFKKKTQRVYIVGIGPGSEEFLTPQAREALLYCDVIVGYSVYIKLLGEAFQNKELLSTPMRQEVERCRLCFEKAESGKTVALICSGDAGIYGLASLMYEMGQKYPKVDLQVIPGITAASSGAAVLGAPLNHDFCVISLSDLLTPWETIEKRLTAAAMGDFAIVIYNPSSHKRVDYLKHACDILLHHGVEPKRACGYVENIGREETDCKTCTLLELREQKVNMFTTVFIGNSQSIILNGKLITKRGYHL